MGKILLRIHQFADSQGLSIREIERNTNTTNGVISKAIKNGSEIGSDKVENFLQSYSEVSAEWLLRGEGEMLKKEVSPDSDSVVRLAGIIAQQAEEIGRLKALLANKGGNAETAEGSSCANVG